MNETVMNYNKYDTDTNYSFVRYIIKQMIFFFWCELAFKNGREN